MGVWKESFALVLLLTSLLTSSCQGQTASEALCAAQMNCGACISASPDCAWCNDESTVTDTRCRPVSAWIADDQCRNVTNPPSRLVVQRNTPLMDTVQVSPQQFNISLRPGETVSFDVYVRPAENFPVDLYYLMDLSYSMRDDLENLKLLGQQLADGLKAKTKDVWLGFGTFVDKTVDPYVDMAHLDDPCGRGLCRRPFPFINNLPLTPLSNLFVDKVNNESISGNLDFPEGGMDALMQVLACWDEIKWRHDARRIVVVATDAGFHFAGDGKLGGAVIPHDGNCYLDKDGAGGRYREDVAKRLDYPSIGQINYKLTTTNIIPVFAVVRNYIGIYNNLRTQLTGAFTGTLASDSGNVVTLIQSIYDQIVSSVSPVIPPLQGITIGVKAQCSKNATDGPEVRECHNVALGSDVKFTFNITAARCEDIRQIKSGIDIRFIGFGDIKVAVTPVCDCACENQRVENASRCEGGALVCGQCQCLPGRFGDQCQCDQDNAEDSDKCRAQNATADSPVCNGRGECVCGECQCRENFVGQQCQCSVQACSRDNNGDICGGSQRGECTCSSSDLTPKCLCTTGFTGADCSCPVALDTCREQPSDEFVCNDHGVCTCGRCVCHPGFRGTLCSGRVCTGDACALIGDSCSRNEDCAECRGFRTGPFAANCSTACRPLISGSEEIPEGLRQTDCPGTTADGCSFSFTVLRNSDNSVYGLIVEPGKDCPESFPYVPLVLGVIFGLAALVLLPLIVWKLLTRYKDGLEYKRFQEERTKAKWSKEQNPMYREPVQKNVNPAYGKA